MGVTNGLSNLPLVSNGTSNDLALTERLSTLLLPKLDKLFQHTDGFNIKAEAVYDLAGHRESLLFRAEDGITMPRYALPSQAR